MPKTGLSSEMIRSKAIDLAEERIRKIGFEKIRLIDVAKDLGITHPVLYQHFPDKAALLEAVTNKWLVNLDQELEKILKIKKKAKLLIIQWFTKLHELKKNKVSLDPELYKAFDMAAEENKACIQSHLKNTHMQLSELVTRAMQEGSIRKGSISKIVEILFLSTMAFHYPKLVALNLNEDQKSKLREILTVVMDGLRY